MTKSQLNVISIFRKFVVLNKEDKTVELKYDSVENFWKEMASESGEENWAEYARMNYKKFANAIRLLQFARSEIKYRDEIIPGTELLEKWKAEKYSQIRIQELIEKYLPENHAYKFHIEEFLVNPKNIAVVNKQHNPRTPQTTKQANEIVWVYHNDEWVVYSVHHERSEAIAEMNTLKFKKGLNACVNYPPIKVKEIERKKSKFISQLAELDM